MDAFLGAETRAFFKSLQLQTRVVRNTWRPQPRTMVFTSDQPEWVANLVQALAAGQNVAVASMSSDLLHSLKTHLVAELALLTEDELLLYDSKADDALKKRVQLSTRTGSPGGWSCGPRALKQDSTLTGSTSTPCSCTCATAPRRWD
jgi:hypothetical protein